MQTKDKVNIKGSVYLLLLCSLLTEAKSLEKKQGLGNGKPLRTPATTHTNIRALQNLMQLSNHCEGAICCLAPLLGTGGKRNTSSAMQTIVEMHHGFTSQHYQELTSPGYLLHALAIHHKLTWCLHIAQSSCTLVELRGKGEKKDH